MTIKRSVSDITNWLSTVNFIGDSMTEILDFEYFQNNQAEFLALTPEEQAIILGDGSIEKVDDKTEAKETQAQDEISEDDLNLVLEEEGEETFIESKNGKHKIPYSELTEAREREHQARLEADNLKRQIEQQAQLLADLQAAKQDDAGTGETAAQDAVIADFKDKYLELIEQSGGILDPDSVDQFKELLNAAVGERIKDIEGKLETAIAKLQQKEQAELAATQAEQQAKAIEQFWDKHPKWNEIKDSEHFLTWLNNQPANIKDAVTGDANDIKMFRLVADAYVGDGGDTGFKKADSTTAKPSKVVKESTEPVKVPKTLANIAGESGGNGSPEEEYLNMTSAQQAAFLAAKEDDPKFDLFAFREKVLFAMDRRKQ